ncbi:hypothetical protein Bca52824_076108 [Brassica carinata]|uniref:Uncharacterized protein n=1 Tax=Brassica carinata TaxID=52824 RepID=A0A8X7TX00_BRACI|nr:hypothetical protein Bca52824_076108 [Brassica carinata]
MRDLELLKTSTNHQPWPPIGAPMNLRREEPCKSRFDEDSVNAVSFGFVATAILISMFLLMAIFEKLIRTTTNPDSSSGRILSGIDSRVGFSGSAASKLGYQSPKAILMPGDNIPTFIAHPVPVPHPSQHISKSQHQHSSSRDSSNSNSIQEC